MELHLLDLMSYQMWTLVCALFYPIIAAIATFVCLRRARTPQKLIGFFIIIPIYVALTAILCADTGSIMSNLLHPLGVYPVIGFLSAICLGIICLNFIALIGGAGVLKRRGAIINTIASFICLGANIFLTYRACDFAWHIYENKLFRNDCGMISIQDALPFTESLSFLPEQILDSGIEMLALAILAIYLIIYFLSFLSVKSRDEIVKEDLERRRRAALLNHSEKRDHDKHMQSDTEEDEQSDCCACCEHATILKGDRTKMVCDMNGVVSSSHVCRKYLYDPLKRTAIRPKIDPAEETIETNIDI